LVPGSIGRHLVPQALALGHEVTALVRDPSKFGANLGARHERLNIVTGDALDPVAVDAAVLGQDAVIFSLGRSNHRAPTTMFSDAIRILIHAMKTHGVRRLVCITGIGAGDSRGHGGFLYDKVIFPWFTKEARSADISGP
jgi:putative NADH-flavin reductase